MPNSNYKSKWLAALKENEDSPMVAADKSEKVVQAINSTNVNASVAFSQIQAVAYEAVNVARSLLMLMDQNRSVGELNFGEAGLPIDGKLSQMTLPVMLRRIRDTMKIAEARIGILSIASSETHAANLKLRAQIKLVETSQTPLQRAVVEASFIGPRATTPEYDDFKEAAPGDYARFGIKYEDLDDDWFDSQFLPNNRNGADVEDDTDGDTDSDDEAPAGTVATRSRGTVDLDLGL